MPMGQNSRVTMMLTVDNGVWPPLDLSQWNGLVRWLVSRSMYPEDLLVPDVDLSDAPNSGSIRKLLDVGLQHFPESWDRAGIWMMTRSDVDYPDTLRVKLRDQAPVCLFGSGDRSLLQTQPSLAIVGSWDAPEDALEYCRNAGAAAAAAGCTVISGSAHGVDEAAMHGCLAAGGSVVGVAPHGLLKMVSKDDYRDWPATSSLTLISHRSPDAESHGDESMRRNSYIYALADAALVVHSGKSRGTWRGAIQNLKAGWTPVFARADGSRSSRTLVKVGAQVAPELPPGIDVEALVQS